MSPDMQEAQSMKYSGELYMILPLTSGRFAVLNPRREVIDIVVDVNAAATAYANYRKALTSPVTLHWHKESEAAKVIPGLSVKLDI
jgi:hypothetical protein